MFNAPQKMGFRLGSGLPKQGLEVGVRFGCGKSKDLIPVFGLGSVRRSHNWGFKY